MPRHNPPRATDPATAPARASTDGDLPQSAATPGAPGTDASPADVERVLDALVIAGAPRGRTALVKLLRALEWRRARGGWFDGNDVGGSLRLLAAAGRARAGDGEGWTIRPAEAEPLLGALLDRPESTRWWQAWLAATTDQPTMTERPIGWFTPRTRDDAVALTTLVLVGGLDAKAYASLANGPLRYTYGSDVLVDALARLLRLGRFERIEPTLRWTLLATVDAQGLLFAEPALLRWADAHLAGAPPEAAFAGLRLRIAEARLHRGDGPGLRAAIGDDLHAAPFLPVLEALLPAWSGRFTDAAAAFPPAWKTLTALLGKRRGFAPPSLLQWYPIALMAQPDASAWTLARRFCVAMSGSRTPSPFDSWGRWAHVLAVRLGDARLEPSAFEPPRDVPGVPGNPDDLADRVILAAWLGQAPERWRPAQLDAVVAALHATDLSWKADLVVQACVHLGRPAPQRPAGAPSPWPVAYFRPRQDAWREALAAIAALGDGRTATVDRPLGTLHWVLTLDDEGRVHDLNAYEPSATGRGRPKALTLLQLKKRTRLDPRDAAVARCVRQGRHRANDLSLDLVQAVQALQGHPHVAFVDAPDVVIELVESLPVLEVRRERAPEDTTERFVFRLHDALIAAEPPELEHHVPEYERLAGETERRDGLRIVRDAPGRARLVRITPAQRRVAELVAQRWSVPVDAGAELDAALRVLSAHFVLHSDAEAGERVDCDARLVAQLQPRGPDLQLMLGVRPFGGFGPMLAPGRGRTRLMTMQAGVSLATERSLETERRHLAAVLESLPFLADGVDETPADATWLLVDPEQALVAVHRLGELSQAGDAVRALEWPKGRSLRIHAPDATALATAVRSGQDWFALDGELRIDESRVLSLQQLLALLRDAGTSRYVALGEGRYLRLADALRQRLAELDALADTTGGRLTVGASAGAWLADAAPVLGLKGDAGWRRRVADLERAAALEPAPPPGLQAELRPYQHDGYVWMVRLAQAGFGAILADDMGLGKTVQTLALLLSRAALGPALVVAPTSVCDNWADEAARFAPGLRAEVYGRGDGERTARIDTAGDGDLVVVSYALLLRDAERFAGRAWATLVLDEAQALKNAATQRVQAVAALQAGFRLALTGTPIENRLADLWSVMNLLNPGLLGSVTRFTERFASPIERQRDDAARHRLRRLVSPFLLRRTKAQVLPELPPRTEIVHRIEPDSEERAFLEAMRREALERIAALDLAAPERSRFSVLAELTRLRRAACDPRLAAPGIGRIGAKVRAFERLAAELVESRHQVLVFSQFTDVLALLAERLDTCGLRYRVLDGSTPAAARAECVAAFQRGDADLFLISLKAGGFGLNLTAADYVIITDPWWNPAAEDQASGRAHRIGQHRPVTVYRLVTAGSIEERIVALHHDKRALAEGVLAGQDGAAPLSPADLVALLSDAG